MVSKNGGMNRGRPAIVGVIMAGGSGKRFWPVSRQDTAKQYLKLFGKKTLIQTAVDRNARVFGKNLFVCTNVAQKKLVLEQAKCAATSIILEPFPRDTAAAIGLSAAFVQEKFGNCVMGIFPADHLIENDTAYAQAIRHAVRLAETRSDIVVIGVPPSYPATALGYIEKGNALSKESWSVKLFREKPNGETAREYLASGNFFWNAGMFIFQPSVMLAALQEQLPRHYAALQKIRASKFDEKTIVREFSPLEKISIDFGVMEKISNVSVVRAGFSWDDVGSWNAFERLTKKDANNNAVHGQFSGVDSHNNIVYTDSGLVACIGVSGLTIVKHGDSVLVCKKEDVENVKKLVRALEENPRTKKFV